MTDDLKDMSKNDLVREVKRLRHMLAEQLDAAPGVGPEVVVQGIVASRDGTPLVQMRTGEAAWQMSPLDARRHALIVLNAATEAERDAATVEFLSTFSDGDEQFVGGFLAAMRDHRQQAIPGDPFTPASEREGS